MNSPPAKDQHVRRLRNDVDDIYDLLGVVQATVAEHSITLAEHTTTLAEHSITLAEHTTALAEIKTTLVKQSVKLDRIIELVETR